MTLEQMLRELVLKNSLLTEQKYSIARDFANKKIDYMKKMHKNNANLKKVNEHNHYLLQNYNSELLEMIRNELNKYNNIYKFDKIILRNILTNILNQLYPAHDQKLTRKHWLSICCEYIMNELNFVL